MHCCDPPIPRPPDIDRLGLTADGVAAPFDVMTAACQSGPRTALIDQTLGLRRPCPAFGGFLDLTASASRTVKTYASEVRRSALDAFVRS